MNNSGCVNLSPKARPLPTFFFEQNTFSTKKEKETPRLREIHPPPRPPIKSCPPISRLKPLRKQEHGARVISFVKNTTLDKSNLLNNHYDANQTNLFFEQCFIIEGILGCGSFGKVYKVKSKEDGKHYAVKKSREKFKGDSDRIRKLEEVAKHEELPPHPNCVKFYRAWEEKQRLYIQTELCQTSLSAYALKHHNIPESVIWQVLIDLLLAVKHLHDRKLVHMDIKPENIFISFDGRCKLGDFGLVLDLKNELKEVQEGDPKYLAPEILVNSNNISCAADVFSLGMTILELATDLDLPRSGDAWHQLRNGQIPSHLISSLSPSLVEIIMRMIEPDHLKRSNVNELLEIPKIKSLLINNKTKILLTRVNTSLKTIISRISQFLMTIFYFIIQPFQQLKNVFIKNYNNKQKNELVTRTTNITTTKTTMATATTSSIENKRSLVELKLNDNLLIENDNNNNNLTNNNDLEKMQTTSTPKRTHLHSSNPLIQVDDDETRNQNIFANDSICSNNSYGNPLIDDISSSFSDHSDFSASNRHNGFSSRKAKTEPLPNKINKANFLGVEGYCVNNSPCKTPPWKPISSFVSYGNETTPIGPTRQRLVFDEGDEQNNLDKLNSKNNDNSNSKHLTKSNLDISRSSSPSNKQLNRKNKDKNRSNKEQSNVDIVDVVDTQRINASTTNSNQPKSPYLTFQVKRILNELKWRFISIFD